MKRVLLGAALFLLVTATVLADEAPPALYDPDPQHIFNRLYAAIAVRTEGGKRFGIDSVTAFQEPFDDSARVAALADELVARKELVSSLGELKRALLLHDVWTAFDVAASLNDRKALGPLARAVGALAMDEQSIARLPNNYAEAVRSGSFARDFDPEHTDRAFLPADLFDQQGPWIPVGETGTDLVAPLHVSAVSARSAFMVFIRCPGGREATLGYLQTLNLYRAPFEFVPDPLGTAYEPSGERPVRTDVIMLNRKTPQFPPGTVVALVRQMAVVNDKLQPVMTRITQSIQFRAFKTNDWDWSRTTRESFERSQHLFEITMTRADLLGRRSGGLHQLAADETSQELTGSVRMEWTRAQKLRGPVVMATCVRCHAAPGIFSVNTYTGRFDDSRHRALNPSLPPSDDPDYQRKATMDRKMQRYDWGLLQGILTGR
jgi:hypothetical protein